MDILSVAPTDLKKNLAVRLGEITQDKEAGQLFANDIAELCEAVLHTFLIPSRYDFLLQCIDKPTQYKERFKRMGWGKLVPLGQDDLQ